MELEKEKYKLTRLYKIAKRRIKVFKQAKDIENIIVNLEMPTPKKSLKELEREKKQEIRKIKYT